MVGAGTAFSFIPVSIGALAGVAERDAGVASGPMNTSQQLGGAIGVAVASTVAATHSACSSAKDTPPRPRSLADSSGRCGYVGWQAWPPSPSPSCSSGAPELAQAVAAALPQKAASTPAN